MADNNKLPDPILRTEKYLAKIAENTANLDPTPTILMANKTITQNGVVEPDSGFDGFAKVTANVPNTYTAADEGKVVDNGELVTQIPTVINTNTTVDTTLYNQVTVSVPNTYTAEDEGKVVNNGALTAQTATNITSNGTVDTTLNNQAVVNVPNTYTQADEGKVVDNGALVAQTTYPTTITVNDTYDTTLYNSITVNVPTGGGGSVEEKDVNFYDYDGTCVYSYTAQEFLQLTEMPANPTHEGLTAQGWNWSFSDATSYVTDYGKLQIGQMYVTSDGKTRVYITLNKGKLNPYLGFGVNGTASIDWGDNSTPTTVTGTSTSTLKYTPHTYSAPGNYVISINVTDGSISFLGSTEYGSGILVSGTSVNNTKDIVYRCSVTKIEIGNEVRLSYNSAFYNCFKLKSITLPNTITELGLYTFNACISIKHITVPSAVTSLVSSFIYDCFSLETLSFPKNSILSEFNLTTSTSLCANALRTVTLPSNISTINNSMCSSCKTINTIIIPEGITTFNNSSFAALGSLTSVTIPSTVTSFSNYVFYNAYALSYIRFKPTTPPTMGTNCFTSLPSDCIVYVPALVSNLYMTASNYPNPSTYKYIGYATYTSGDTLPTLTTDETYTLTWYATVDDAIAGTNPITQGNGNEIYSIATAVV